MVEGGQLVDVDWRFVAAGDRVVESVCEGEAAQTEG